MVLAVSRINAYVLIKRLDNNMNQTAASHLIMKFCELKTYLKMGTQNVSKDIREY